MADVSRDARTLNLARALEQEGLRVATIGISAQDATSRAIARWWKFNSRIASLDVRPRLVVAMDLFALSAAQAVAKKHSIPLLYDMREFYFALGPLAGKGIKQKILVAHERRLVGHVDDVIVSGELDADIVQQRFALKKRPVVLLNTPPYKDPVLSPLRYSLAIPQTTTLALYQGVVHHGRGLAHFLRALPQMPDVHLVVIGDGPAQGTLMALARDLAVDARVSWLGSVPYDELHQLTCGADIGLCLIEPISMSYEYALPNKLFEYMMARIPSLVSDLPALHAHVISHPVGVLVERSLSPTSIVAAMDRAMQVKTRAEMRSACEDIRELAYERQASTACGLIREHLT
ncbi:MAG: glycosyltransferase [Candidatus Kapabacteria bacterium]|nr:glycosyltransferase [Candidatus Kapabacteria bacterium]